MAGKDTILAGFLPLKTEDCYRMGELDDLVRKLAEYRRKYYINRLLRGVFYGIGAVVSTVLLIALLEYIGRFDSAIRLFLLSSGAVLTLVILIYFIGVPLFFLFVKNRGLSYEEAARLLGRHFPGVDDRIIGALQLGRLSTENRDLVRAAIQQRVTELKPVPFTSSIKYGDNRRYLPYLLVPLAVFAGLTLFEGGKEVLRSTDRVMRFQQSFVPPAPFQFVLLNDSLVVEEGSDITIQVALRGNEVPAQAKLLTGKKELRMVRDDPGEFEIKLDDLQKELRFQFQAGNFRSDFYELKIRSVPKVKSLNMEVSPPEYTGLERRTFAHQANVEVPEGSVVEWKLQGENIDRAYLKGGYGILDFEEGLVRRNVSEVFDYEVLVMRRGLRKRAVVPSKVEVRRDESPRLRLQHERDTIEGREFLVVDLKYGDDYGAVRLERVIEHGGDSQVEPLRRNLPREGGFSEVLDLDTFRQEQTTDWSIYYRVWDNDAVNGSKAGASRRITFPVEGTAEQEKRMRKELESYGAKSKEMNQKRQEIDSKLQEAKDKLLTENKLDWESRENIKELLKQLAELQREESKMKEELKKNLDKTREGEKKKEEEALEDISKEEEELNKLKEEIQDLMKKLDKDKLREKLGDLQRENKQRQRKTERSEKMLEDLMFQRDMLKSAEKLQEMAREMKEMSEKAEGKEKDEMAKQREELDEISEKLEEMEKKSDVFENEQEKEDFKKKEQEAREKMEKAMEKVEKASPGEENSDQKESSESMQEMSDMLQSSIMQMQKKSLEMNIQALRQILENLESYSHGVEDVGEEIKELSSGDPKFRKMLQEQNRLKDGSEVIRDSLVALSERAPEVKEKVFEELENMEKSLYKGREELQEQNFGKAAGRMQFAMMAANELALMLDQSLQSMMQMMAAMKPGDQNCQKPGGSNPKPGAFSKKLSEMAEKMDKLQKGSKEGEGRGEKGVNGKELVKILSEQEQLRRELEEMSKEDGENGKGGNKQKALEEMEDIERDLVNRRFDRDFVERYKRIETRMLEDEQAEMERKQKNEREAETATNYESLFQDRLEEYLKEDNITEESILRGTLRMSPFYRTRTEEIVDD